MNDNSKIKLTDLISIEDLKRIEDAFYSSTGITCNFCDVDGSAITECSHASRFCFELTRSNEIGCSMCAECDKFGIEEAYRTGTIQVYKCHTGLTDFVAPIVVDNKLIGAFQGGQILTAPPVRDELDSIALSLGIDPDEYWEAANELNIIEEERVKNAAGFMTTISSFISDVAISKSITEKANEQLARAAKTQADFLANMSHEIRTPMNAITGFAELALREDIPLTARDYIEQIKSSAKALLGIINDILDYSKIESGKFEIIPVVYEPLSVIDDVANITMTRLVEKDVELILDVDPNIPNKLEGDNLRIRQVLINLCNNATKFTNEGYVKISVSYDWVSYSEVSLNFSIEDTGIGIKEDDLANIFSSFKQVDSKRNRNIEGTGLGLAISKLLLELMDSDLVVESTYGKGSVFSFSVIQKVKDAKPSIIIEDPEIIAAAGGFASPYVAESFSRSTNVLGIKSKIYMGFENEESKKNAIVEWNKIDKTGKESYIFVEQQIFNPDLVKDSINNGITTVLLAETFADVREWAQNKDLLILRKPISVMNIASIFNHQGLRYRSNSDTQDLYTFTAEKAKILVVDDNIVNLTVARGLLEPIKAVIDIASSGREALRMIRNKHYDIIFMDHMMPELDGVEATHIIRNDYPDYAKVPIIALTANAMNGVREMFISEGMNDFVPKPIEVRVLLDKVKNYLPHDKIVKDENIEDILYETSNDTHIAPVIADLDTANAIELLGSESLYMSILKIYYESIDSKAENIEKLYKDENWAKYAIEVHALKSSSRQIGAMELGELAYSLEMAGKNLDIYIINRDTNLLLEKYRNYKTLLAPYFNAHTTNNSDIEATKDELEPLFDDMRLAIEDLDMDRMENVLEKLESFNYPDVWLGRMTNLRNAVRDLDVDAVADILDSWF